MTAADAASGQDFTCNVAMLGHLGVAGGFKVFRYVDSSGQECGFYDSTLLFPTDVLDDLGSGDDPAGVFVLDMTDPSKPLHVNTLVTPAMLSPHESLVLNEKRGLLGAVMGNPTLYPGILDLYDVRDDCLHPALLSSSPVGIVGHESGFAPDGNTFYASSLENGDVVAIDVTDPTLPVPLWTGEFSSHGVSVSDDGKRLYFSALHVDGSAFVHLGLDPGLVIVDSTEIQDRVLLPSTPIISKFRWEPRSTPQIAIPVTFDGVPHLIEIDEFAGAGIPDANAVPGVARIIDISDETNPRLVSNIRLEVHQAANRDADQLADPGANSGLGGYTGHYCSVPRENDPAIVACSFILSGLRVFDISDPRAPRELAYFNPGGGQSFAMSAPEFVPERSEIWYTDGNKGFYSLRLTNGVWGPASVTPEPTDSVIVAEPDQPELPATGATIALGLAALAVAAGLALRRLRSPSR